MSINKVDEFNRRRLDKKNEVDNYLSIIDGYSKEKEFSFEIGDVKLELEGLIKKLERDTINIAVVAEVSSGKSTFLNALVFNEPILESKIGETTAKVFHIKYGEHYSVNGKVLHDAKFLKEEISKQNKENLKSISSSEDLKNIESTITLPNENLKKGIELYDTPGFGTVNEKIMNILLKDAISQSDGVILLLDIAQGLKKNERSFVKDMLDKIPANKRFIVLNKYDSVIDEDDFDLKTKEEIEAEIESVIVQVKNTLKSLQEDKSEELTTYYLSAKKGLIAKFKCDNDKLKESRFDIFEGEFWTRVVEAKQEVFNDIAHNYKKTKSQLQISLHKEKDSRIQSYDEITQLIDISHQVEDELNTIIECKKNITISIPQFREDMELSIIEDRDLLEKNIRGALIHHIEPKLNDIGGLRKMNPFGLKDKYEDAVKIGIKNSEKDLNKVIQNEVQKSFKFLSKKENEANKIVLRINNSLITINSFNDDLNLTLVEEIKFGFNLDGDSLQLTDDSNVGYDAGDFMVDLGISGIVGGVAFASLEFGLARLLPLVMGPIGWLVSAVLAIFTLWKASDKSNEMLDKIIGQTYPAVMTELNATFSKIESFTRQSIGSISQHLRLIDERIKNIEASLNNREAQEKISKELQEEINLLSKFIKEVS